MSETKHTPGPWRYTVRNDNGLPATLYADNDGCDVDMADFCMDWVEAFCDEAHANARLIAAAPELLAALVELDRVSAGLSDYDGIEIGGAPEAWQQARAAINKAQND